jgi:Family of unknown function (DUF6988)
MPTFTENLTYATAVKDTAGHLLEGLEFPRNARLNLVIAYVSLVREHQHAIYELVRLRLYGSAFALLRPLFETGVRALWVLGLASDEQVEAIGQHGGEPFPKFTSMCELVDARFRAEGVIDYFATAWKAMCGFTHSGLEQLARRFTGNDVMPSYHNDEISELLGMSASIVIMVLVPYFITCGLQEQAEELQTLVLL